MNYYTYRKYIKHLCVASFPLSHGGTQFLGNPERIFFFLKYILSLKVLGGNIFLSFKIQGKFKELICV